MPTIAAAFVGENGGHGARAPLPTGIVTGRADVILDEEGGQISRIHRARQAGAERCDPGAELVPGEDPAKHQIGAFGPKALRGEAHGRRHRRDPVEAVEHRKQRQSVEREIGERQKQQRQAAQAVIPEQEISIVVTVRQPARDDGAEEIENAHGGEQACGLHLRDAKIEAHRDQMHLDQAVGRGAADEEGGEQDPEHVGFRGIAQGAKCGRHDRRVIRWRSGQRLGALVAERAQADVARPIAHDEQDQKRGNAEHDADQRKRDAPTVAVGQAGKQRQEHQLPGRDACGQDADHQAPARHEPARGNGGAQYQRGHAGAEPDDDAPQQHQLPHLRHHERSQQAGDDNKLRRQRHITQAVAVHQRGSEWRH